MYYQLINNNTLNTRNKQKENAMVPDPISGYKHWYAGI
ncbi:hypothetical protein L248_1916 [Schleiferilactobacillus shenzhenensis LY-73]|uniref:Uncharacterized protein n=1 Tax=Schleiferilactobacillus shenzhenensis LY-73 TaxID=1231336 RepID=U4TLV7_9LACO|nr:hypothetical protein L248_1916 [Schleiferilactobacillus shenzhenensis LY-73]